MPPRIPTAADFAPLASTLPLELVLPSPPESTTSFLILLHGLGDSHVPFARFARALALPGVAAIAVRGTSPLPPSLLPDEHEHTGGGRFHWGDDVLLDQATGEIDPDPGFANAAARIMHRLVGDVIVGALGWEVRDIFFFGFGQGGSLALGLALQGGAAKGAVSIGGPLPASMVVRGRRRGETPVLVVQLDGGEADRVRREFGDVTVVDWGTRELAMPRSREQVYPLMKFFADQLNKPYR